MVWNMVSFVRMPNGKHRLRQHRRQWHWLVDAPLHSYRRWPFVWNNNNPNKSEKQLCENNITESNEYNLLSRLTVIFVVCCFLLSVQLSMLRSVVYACIFLFTPFIFFYSFLGCHFFFISPVSVFAVVWLRLVSTYIYLLFILSIYEFLHILQNVWYTY